MGAKKLLCHVLIERTETIEYRKVRSQLMNIAQNKGRFMLILKLQSETITMLQNQGIKVEQVEDFGYKKYKLSW